MLHRLTDIVAGLVVYPQRMLRNIESTRGVVFSGRLLNELTARGMGREDAYRIVQAHAMAALEGGDDFRQRVAADAQVRAVLSEQDLEAVFRLESFLAHVDAIFARVFAGGATA
jgi:adenylosuccinate lyase